MKKIVLFFLAAILASFSAYAEREIKGTVVSEADGEPLIGASVVPVGVGGGGTATDFDGNFAIVLPDGVDDITVSYIGMQSKTVKAADGMTVKLQENGRRGSFPWIASTTPHHRLTKYLRTTERMSGKKLPLHHGKETFLIRLRDISPFYAAPRHA